MTWATWQLRQLKAAKGESVEANVDSGTEIVTKDNAQARIDRLNGYLGK